MALFIDFNGILPLVPFTFLSMFHIFIRPQLSSVWTLLYIIGFILLVLVLCFFIFCIYYLRSVHLQHPLLPNIVIFFLFRILNFCRADLRSYLWFEVCLSLIVLNIALQYMTNWYIVSKLRWIRRESRLLGAVCDDISKALHDTHFQRIRMNLELTEQQRQCLKTTKDVVSKAEPLIKAFPPRAKQFLSWLPVLFHLIKLLSISKNISNLRKESAFHNGIYNRLQESHQSLDDMWEEDESGYAILRQLTNQVSSILKEVTANLHGERNLELKLVLLEAFLKDIKQVKLESAIEKAWFEEMKDFLDDIHDTFKTFRQRNERLRKLLLDRDVDWMADGLAELLEVKNKLGFKFTIIQQQTHPYQNDVNNQDLISSVKRIRAHLNQTSPEPLPVPSDEGGYIDEPLNDFFQNVQKDLLYTNSDLEIENLCKRLEKMNTQLKEIEGASKFRLVFQKQMNDIVKELEEAFQKYLKEMDRLYSPKQETSTTESEIKDLESPKLETSTIESKIKDLERTITALDSRVRQKYSSLEEDTDALVSKLTDSSVQCRVLSIVGMWGIGKTTLAAKVCRDRRITNVFPVRRLISVPQSFNNFDDLRENVGKKIIENTASEQEQERGEIEEEYIQKIRNFLQQNRYLVVLDNVPTMAVWKELEILFPESSNGSKVLLTTRDMTLASHDDQSMKCHQLRLRTKDESLKLFLEKAQFSRELLSHDEFMRKVREVVAKCWGLPLPLSSLGLARKPLYSEQVKTKIEEFNRRWTESLQIGNLPSSLTPFLYYFTSIPINFGIPARRLIALWVAEGLVGKEDDERKPENIAEDWLSKLIDLNVIQPMEKNVSGKVKTCCLPKPWRDLLPSKNSFSDTRLADHYDCNADSFGHIHGTNNDLHRPDDWKKYENLVSVISFDAREGDKPGNDIGNFLRKGIANGCLKKLRVLDLERVFRPRLPETIDKLIELRYLGLRWTYLEEIPLTIGNLPNLRTLDLKHTYIRTLPNTIWKLQKLQHLYLDRTHRSRFVHHSKTRSLHNLQTLRGAFLDENSPLKNWVDQLKSLRKLELAFQLSQDQQKDLVERISNNLEHLQSLRLMSVNVMSEPQVLYLRDFSRLQHLSSMYLFGRLQDGLPFPKFPDSLSDLTLSSFRSQCDPMQVLGKLPNLRALSLFSDSFTGQQIICSRGGFPQLLVLKIWKLNGLKNWTIEEQTMQKLKDLEIRSCSLLKFPDGLMHLETLYQLKLKKMSEDFMQDIPSSPHYQLLIT